MTLDSIFDLLIMKRRQRREEMFQSGKSSIMMQLTESESLLIEWNLVMIPWFYDYRRKPLGDG